MKVTISSLRIEYYSIWLIANFIICLLPIGITYIITNNIKAITASYIAFIFTRIVGSLYAFHIKKDEVKFEKLIFWSTLFYALLSIASLPIYMDVEQVSTFLSNSTLFFYITSFVITVVFCLMLNCKILEEKIKEKYLTIKLATETQKTEKKFQNYKTEIENN